ncbi:hypothetical protein C1H46_008441 [Malus baccata]|uniref:Saposin B-type domain-containing protein n=1 Tax=Malus baccata TaxID=106549 RepID=A0A540N4D2_MALBA|nr:hypothetical protein C1H46_008441 [Malus baccata]
METGIIGVSESGLDVRNEERVLRAEIDTSAPFESVKEALEIIELLLKACNSVENYTKKCKRLVFEYGPLILTNAEQFLETTDICTALHACNSNKASITEHISNLSAS